MKESTNCIDELKRLFKKYHPRAHGFIVVNKAGVEKAKDMSEFQKTYYNVKSQQKKQEHNKSISTYKMQTNQRRYLLLWWVQQVV